MEKKTFYLKNADVSSHMTYGHCSLKKKCSEYVDKHLYQVSCFFHDLKYFSLNFLPRNTSECYIFHDVNSILYTVHPQNISIFHDENSVLFSVTSIHSIRKSTKKTETLKQHVTQDGKQQKIQDSNRKKVREIKVIDKEVWKKRKEKVLNTRMRLIHNAKVIYYCSWRKKTWKT